MKFSLFILLLEFVPETIKLVHKRKTLGNYKGTEFFWNDSEVQNMEIEVVEIDHTSKKVTLEVIK